MVNLSEGDPNLSSSEQDSKGLPINSIVRAVCEAANAGPDLLYEVMIKLSLMVESMAPTYGLSIWTGSGTQKPRLEWAEGLGEEEIAAAEEVVGKALTPSGQPIEINEGDSAICLVLTLPRGDRSGAVIYGRCVRPLDRSQARDLKTIVEVAYLAHSSAVARNWPALQEGRNQAAAIASSTLPGMVFSSRAMAEVARAVEKIKDSDSTVLVNGESGTGKELI